MTIKEAIQKAKATYEWNYVPYDPFTALVGFVGESGREDETCIDLYSDNPERELEEVWKELAKEFGAKPDSVTYIESH